MATTDLIALFTTLVIVGGVIYVILYVSRGFQDTVQTTKESLKSRGFDVSGSGISIRTDKRFDREAYLDATQRGMVSLLGASSIGRSISANHAHAQPPPTTAGAHPDSVKITRLERRHSQDGKQHKGHWDHLWKGGQHEERHRKPWDHFRKGKHPEQEVL